MSYKRINSYFYTRCGIILYESKPCVASGGAPPVEVSGSQRPWKESFGKNLQGRESRLVWPSGRRRGRSGGAAPFCRSRSADVRDQYGGVAAGPHVGVQIRTDRTDEKIQGRQKPYLLYYY